MPSLALAVDRPRALFDEPVAITLRGLPAGRRVTIDAEMTDAAGVVWRSSGRFFADANGAVDLRQDASIAGTYTGIDADGLFWSMTSLPIEEAQRRARDPESKPFARVAAMTAAGAYVYKLRATGPQGAIASAEVSYSFGDALVRRTEVREGRLRGALFEPRIGAPKAALLLIGGSFGGVEDRLATLLAARGIAVFAQAWIGYADLPRWPRGVPIEQFVEGLAFLQARTGRKQVALSGISWGTEAASLTAQMAPERISALALLVPAPMPTSGYDPSETADPLSVAKFSIAGKPVAFANPGFPRNRAETRGMQCGFDTPYDVREQYLRSWQAPANAGLAYDFAKLRAPILLTSGEADEVWPSAIGAEMIAASLVKAGYRYRVEVVGNPGATHLTYVPRQVQLMIDRDFEPIMGCFIGWGGMRAQSAAAAVNTYQSLLRFVLTTGRGGRR